MSSIHYKFRSSLEYDTLTFDGPSISLSDLRDAIIQQKKIGKSSDFTLEVTNAQTKEGKMVDYSQYFARLGFVGKVGSMRKEAEKKPTVCVCAQLRVKLVVVGLSLGQRGYR